MMNDPFDHEHYRPHLVGVRCVTKSSIGGKNSRPHLVKSPLCDKVLRRGAIFGPHLVGVHLVTSPPMRGNLFRPHLVNIFFSTTLGHDSHNKYDKSLTLEVPFEQFAA